MSARYPTPAKEGHFWGKLIHPRRMPIGEDWRSIDYEVMQVYDNNGEGSDRYRVFVPGVSPSQCVEDFVWGPEVPQFKGPDK